MTNRTQILLFGEPLEVVAQLTSPNNSDGISNEDLRLALFNAFNHIAVLHSELENLRAFIGII